MNDLHGGLSRRDFLKLSGAGLLGLLLPGRARSLLPDPGLQGRITSGLLWAYDEPSNKAKRIKMYWRDLVVPISATALDDDTSLYNRVWYETAEGAYLYSGWVQPVRTVLNQPYYGFFPTDGLLGEVTVPFTDAHEKADKASKVAYRMYYETTHWLMETVVGADGEAWYRVFDDKWKKFYFAPAKHLRLIPDEELSPLSPNVPPEKKRVEVQLDNQLMLAYEDDRLVYAARIASGAIFRVGTYTTPTGTFMTYHKRPTRHMAAGDLAASGFDLPGVPWVLYITESGISFHGTYWHNDFGRPRSHGCINLSPAAAKWLFRWTSPTVDPRAQFAYESTGTVVNIVE